MNMKEKPGIETIKYKGEKELYLASNTNGMEESLYKTFNGWRKTMVRSYLLLNQGY